MRLALQRLTQGEDGQLVYRMKAGSDPSRRRWRWRLPSGTPRRLVDAHTLDAIADRESDDNHGAGEGKDCSMRIIVVGGAGAVGRTAVAALSGRHEIVVAGRRSGSVRVDIRSADSVRAMYQEVGRFDAVVCAAGDAHLGPFDAMSEAEFGVGIESKLLGQVRLVLLGRALIADGGSFTLMSGYIFDDPIRGSSSYAAANGGVEGWRTGEIIRAWG